MPLRLGFVVALAALSITLVPAAANDGERLSTLGDQTSVAVTIYNDNLALVRDQRRVHLARGVNRLAYRDVSAQIKPETALLKSLTLSGGVSVIEQNFNFDLLSPQKLLEKYVGQTVTIIHVNPGSGRETRERAKVLSTNDGVVLQFADRIETSVDGRIAFAVIPQNLRDRPTLVIDLNSAADGDQNVELDYLAGGLSWRADYVGLLNAADDRLDLSGLVTLTNGSGTTFTNATLQLVAGDVNRVQQELGLIRVRGTASYPTPAPPQFNQQNLFEYHLYTLNRPTTIAEKQTKQVALLSASDVAVVKTLELRGSPFYYYQSSVNSDLGQRMKVGVYVAFANDGPGLGVPLPKGTVRIYKKDASGNAQFVGEDAIDHTPRKEAVRLKLGDAFDVTANRKQTDFNIVSSCCPYVYESAYDIALHNAKDQAVTVKVIEPVPGEWQMVSENFAHTKGSSDTAVWNVRVPANSASTLSYRVRVKW